MCSVWLYSVYHCWTSTQPGSTLHSQSAAHALMRSIREISLHGLRHDPGARFPREIMRVHGALFHELHVAKEAVGPQDGVVSGKNTFFQIEWYHICLDLVNFRGNYVRSDIVLEFWDVLSCIFCLCALTGLGKNDENVRCTSIEEGITFRFICNFTCSDPYAHFSASLLPREISFFFAAFLASLVTWSV